MQRIFYEEAKKFINMKIFMKITKNKKLMTKPCIFLVRQE